MTLRVGGKDFLKVLAFSILSLALTASPLLAARNPVVRIIVVDKQSEAEDILVEINEGRPFAFLAKERSVDEKSRDRYGEIVAPVFESLDERLKEAALKLSGGEVSRVIALGDNRRALVLMVGMAHYRKGPRHSDREISKLQTETFSNMSSLPPMQ
jgi:foldase protein PrsA